MRNVGSVRDFIKALGDVLADGAKGGGDNEKNKDDRARAPLSVGRRRIFLIVRGRIEVRQHRHCASLHTTC